MARGHRLNTSIVLAAVHGLSGLFRAVSAVEPSLFRPLPPLSPSLISHLASVDVKQNGLPETAMFLEELPSWFSQAITSLSRMTSVWPLCVHLALYSYQQYFQLIHKTQVPKSRLVKHIIYNLLITHVLIKSVLSVNLKEETD